MGCRYCRMLPLKLLLQTFKPFFILLFSFHQSKGLMHLGDDFSALNAFPTILRIHPARRSGRKILSSPSITALWIICPAPRQSAHIRFWDRLSFSEFLPAPHQLIFFWHGDPYGRFCYISAYRAWWFFSRRTPQHIRTSAAPRFCISPSSWKRQSSTTMIFPSMVCSLFTKSFSLIPFSFPCKQPDIPVPALFYRQVFIKV